jgi:hypothetical protein
MRALWLAFLFVFGACATAKPVVPVPVSVVREPERPAIQGEPGERITHLHARIIVRACAGLELEHLAAQTEAFVVACVVDGHPAPECEETACSKLRDVASSRCGQFASR